MKALVARYRERGLLGNLYFISVTKPLVERSVLMEMHDAHLEYQHHLEESGILFAAGPLLNEAGGPSGESMNIYRVSSLAAAQEIVDNDPMHRTKRRSAELRPWVMNEGSFKLELSMSAKKISFS
ncbi:MAG TPA: YciI family protein [Stellaceae bacterium]|nr:YciI family protein [Stellaceae bacterium]